jgi:hypothetical protein
MIRKAGFIWKAEKLNFLSVLQLFGLKASSKRYYWFFRRKGQQQLFIKASKAAIK